MRAAPAGAHASKSPTLYKHLKYSSCLFRSFKEILRKFSKQWIYGEGVKSQHGYLAEGAGPRPREASGGVRWACGGRELHGGVWVDRGTVRGGGAFSLRSWQVQSQCHGGEAHMFNTRQSAPTAELQGHEGRRCWKGG